MAEKEQQRGQGCEEEPHAGALSSAGVRLLAEAEKRGYQADSGQQEKGYCQGVCSILLLACNLSVGFNGAIAMLMVCGTFCRSKVEAQSSGRMVEICPTCCRPCLVVLVCCHTVLK